LVEKRPRANAISVTNIFKFLAFFLIYLEYCKNKKHVLKNFHYLRILLFRVQFIKNATNYPQFLSNLTQLNPSLFHILLT
jgi:hypothetical protein